MRRYEDIRCAFDGIQVDEHRDGELVFVKVRGHEKIDLATTFDCGQSFRFDPVEDTLHQHEISGVAFGKCISFAAEDDGRTLIVYNSTAEEYKSIWHHYLGLDLNYSKINEDILSRSDKEVLSDAVKMGDGIRILSQDPWETVCSFIISQNNNIPRIKKIISSLSRQYGEEISTDHLKGHLSRELCEGAYAFPTPKALADAGVDNIFALRTGFRAKYIHDAATKISEGEISLDEIMASDTTDKAAQILMRVKGIGPKVAACSLLFGFQRYDAFPVDVWIKRVMEKYFGGDLDSQKLGAFAGVAQQYLFYYERYLNS